MDIATVLWNHSRPMRNPRGLGFLPSICLLLPMLIGRPANAAAPTGAVKEATDGQVNLPQAMGWENWQVVRDQRANRAMVKVFVRKGETPATAKVRVMVAQTPKPTFDSPQAILDAPSRPPGISARKSAHTRSARAPTI